MKSGCAPGMDWITTEHLKFGIKTKLPFLFSHLFVIYLSMYCIVPNAFCERLLVPITKKLNVNPSVEKTTGPSQLPQSAQK